MPAQTPILVDRDELARLYLEHGSALRARARPLLAGGPTDVEDVLQDVFVSLLRRIGDAGLPVDAPVSWLHVCVRNACISERRRRHVPPSDAADELPGGRDPLELSLARERLSALRVDIAELPPRQRQAIVSSVLGDAPHREIARALDTNEGSVRMLVCRARRSLTASRDAREAPAAVG